MMSKIASLFAFLLFSLILGNSYALPFDELSSFDDSQNQIIFNSNIVDVDSNFFSENNFKRYLIFGSNSLPDNDLNDNSLYGIKSDHGFFSVSVLSPESASGLVSQGYNVVEDSQLDFHASEKIIPDASRIGQITGSSISMQQYNASGNDIVVAIVDTGVDFSNPDIQHSLARDELNYPMMLDPDGQGIVLTNATFAAFINEYGTIRNYEKEIPSNVTSSVYSTRDGVFLDMSQGGSGTTIQVYNSFYPQFGDSVIFNGTISDDMKIGNGVNDYIKSASGVYHFGVMYQGESLSKIQVVPVLVVDSTIAGVYDTVIPDLSTSWADYKIDDFKSDSKSDYDFDFTDETPKLNSILEETSSELDVLKSEIEGFDSTMVKASEKIDESTGTISTSVQSISEASSQLNSLLFPIIASIGIIVALQITIIARRR